MRGLTWYEVCVRFMSEYKTCSLLSSLFTCNQVDSIEFRSLHCSVTPSWEILESIKFRVVNPYGICLVLVHHVPYPLDRNSRQMSCTSSSAPADCSTAVADASFAAHGPYYCFCSISTATASSTNELKILPEAVCCASLVNHLLTLQPIFSQ